MDHPDTTDPTTEAISGDTLPATPAEASAAVEHPQLGGAWVRQPDGQLVREAHTRDQADTDTEE